MNTLVGRELHFSSETFAKETLEVSEVVPYIYITTQLFYPRLL